MGHLPDAEAIVNEPASWINIADKLLTLGFGILLGGAVGAVTAWMNNSSQAKKALNARRREILEGVTEVVDTFCSEGAKYLSTLRNALFKKAKEGYLSAKEFQRLEDLETHFYESFLLKNSCSAKLLLLGEKEAAACLDNLASDLDHLFKVGGIHSEKCSDGELQKHKETIGKSRKAFFEALSRAYARSV